VRTIEQASAMRRWSREARRDGKRIALVPTMGALHAGHLSLVEIARRQADRVVASVFVNPAQFDRADDLARYPRDLARDAGLLAGAGVDVLFAPGVEEMYPSGASTFVTVEGVSEPLCGLHRPGHFRGVATVVLKLLAVVDPDVAVFGEKDYQQLVLIRRMARDLRLDVEIVGAPIVREADGLALSSRNARLGDAERRAARCLARGLAAAEALAAAGEREGRRLVAAAAAEIAAEPLARAEYASLVDPETLAPVATLEGRALLALAAWVGGTRLIDNRLLDVRIPTVAAAGRERRSA
jgi:pantoate--beta-alanine ligase